MSECIADRLAGRTAVVTGAAAGIDRVASHEAGDVDGVVPACDGGWSAP